MTPVDHPAELLLWRESVDLQKPKLVHTSRQNEQDGTTLGSWRQQHQGWGLVWCSWKRLRNLAWQLRGLLGDQLNLCRYCPRRTGTYSAITVSSAVLAVTMAVRCAACAVDFVKMSIPNCYAPDAFLILKTPFTSPRRRLWRLDWQYRNFFFYKLSTVSIRW